ncbi:sugar ABC transporter ATP-binding protein [Candidatus Bipolaricaulota bacterium]|nr:sugar ABC transporter ATP-binding protein [Candidatus Bipolaricaulota bacterium]
MDTFLELRDIDKSFPGVHAVDHVNIEVGRAEVHMLLGENGAGKSTLMKILSGAQQADSGTIIYNGRKINVPTPKRALELGIGMVYQELSLVPTLTVAENIVLGSDIAKNRLGVLDWDSIDRRANEALETLGVNFDTSKKVEELGLGKQQLVEIAKIISHEADLIILDEPTSALTEAEQEKLFNTINRLKKQDVSFIYITHKMEEVFELGDRITVLRNGKSINTLPAAEADEDQLVKMMVGRRLENQYPKEEIEPKETILEVKDLTTKKLKGISFSLRRGEILGLGGLLGAGRSELLEAIFGLREVKSGSILLDGKPLNLRSPVDAVKNNIALLTKDRHNGLVETLQVDENITMADIEEISNSGWLRLTEEEKIAEKFIKELEIATPSLDQHVKFLSGGNQQKVVLAKWLASNADVFLLHEPTRGIDVGTKVEVYNLMNDLAAEGKGIILVSSELPELLSMSDRILVLREGKIVSEHDRDDVTQEEIVANAAGASITD